MTDSTTATPENVAPDDNRPTPDPTPTPTPDEPQTPPESDTENGRRRRDPNAEAAASRVRLRETEAKLDAANQRIQAANRRDVENLLTHTATLTGTAGDVQTLHRAADLFEILGADPDAFHDDNGHLDATAVADYIAEHVADRPYLQVPKRYPTALEVVGNLRRTNLDGTPVTGKTNDMAGAWAKILRPQD